MCNLRLYGESFTEEIGLVKAGAQSRSVNQICDRVDVRSGDFRTRRCDASGLDPRRYPLNITVL